MTTDNLPEWWPDWMAAPTGVAPLGACLECGAQQWTVGWGENHFGLCSRAEPPEGPHRKVPWPRNWAGTEAGR